MTKFLKTNSKITSTNTGGYRYFFNGQESDNEVFGETALHAFEFRMHDARLGRFWSVDPLAAKYPWNSTYAFCENTPIWARELEGLEAVIGISMGGDVEYRKGILKSINSTAIVKTVKEAGASSKPNEIEQLRKIMTDATTNDPEQKTGYSMTYKMVYSKKGSFYKFKRGETPEEVGDDIDMIELMKQGTSSSK